MRLLADIVEGGALGLWAAATPGAFQATLVARSARAGVLGALPLAFVPIATDPVVIAAVLLVLLQLPAVFLQAVSALGIAVVLAIAFFTLRAAFRGDRPDAGAPHGFGFLQAALVNLTTPGAWIFWSTVGGPTLTRDWRAGAAHAAAFLASFYACIFTGNAVVVAGAGAIARAGPRAARALGGGSGALLLGFAGWQSWRLAAELLRGG